MNIPKHVYFAVPVLAIMAYSYWEPVPDESAMTVDEYALNCAEVSDREFEANCEGKTIIFDGFIRSVEDNDELEVDVISSDDRIQGFDLFLKRDYEFGASWDMNQGRGIRFAGTLEDNDFNDHNIEDGMVIELGDLSQTQANKNRITTIRNEEKAQEAGFSNYAAMQSCQADWQDCPSHDLLVNTYGKIEAAREACKASAISKMPAGEVETGFLNPFKTTLDGENALETGIVTLIDPLAKKQDANGEMVTTPIRCRFDLKTNLVESVSFG